MTGIKKSGLLPGEGSFSSRYLANRSDIPQVSAIMANSVSQERRVLLASEVESGLFRDGSGPTYSQTLKKGEEAMGGVIGGGTPFVKQGQAFGGGGGFQGGVSGDTFYQAPEVYSPLWLNSNLNLPRDRATINAWCRSFFALNPFVHNAINLHSTYPISKLTIKCPNKDIEKFFNDMIEEIDLMNICVQIAQEYWLLGESFVYAELDEGKGKWSRLHIQNPDFMVVQRTVVASEPVIRLRPDQNLKNIIFSNRASDIEQRKQLSPHIVDSVRRGQNIPMDNFNVSHLARRISPYEIRGTGLPVCIFRMLYLFDQLRESKYVQAAGMINPLNLIKIGTPEGFKPTNEVLESYREVFAQAHNNKNFTVFTHDGVSVERIGWGQGIYDISGDITQLIKEIYVGLLVPSVIMDGGADTTYANGGVALDVLRQRYMQFRNMLSQWLKRKIFAPISKIQGFYDYSGGEKQLIVPEIDWNHMSLFDTGDYIQSLIQITSQSQGKAKTISTHTLYRSLGLDYQDEQQKIRKENIQDAINAKEVEALSKMDLASLQSLDEDDEIPEPTDPNAPTGQEAPLPGETAGGGSSGMPDLGGLSGMPSGGAGGTLPTPPPTPAGGPPETPPAPPPPK